MGRLQRLLFKLIWAGAGLIALGAGQAMAQTMAPAHGLLGVDCAAPPAYHCPDSDCPGAMQTQPGDTVEMKSRRT